MAKPRIKLPESARVGEIIEIRAIIQHIMETGNRKDANGQIVPRNIIHTFIAKFADQVIFRGGFGPGIAANPSLAFYLKVPGPGQLELTWIDDHNITIIERVPLNVVGA
jgi:sulfur-oxidizing protein SoxZ